MNYPVINIPIKLLAEEDRPREKLLQKGKESLSDAELLSLLIGSGTRQETAIRLCQRILKNFENDLNALGRVTAHELMKFNGIGEAKAGVIMAALELGRRRRSSVPKQKLKISSSTDVFNELRAYMADLPHEEFWALYLNRSNKVIHRER